MPRVASPVLHLERIVFCVALVPLHHPPAVSPRLALRSLLSEGSGQLVPPFLESKESPIRACFSPKVLESSQGQGVVGAAYPS